MSQELVQKKAKPLAETDGLTIMQRKFCEYLILNEGRTTATAAAIHAGYAENSAAVEGSRLRRNPKIESYIRKRSNEVNRAYVVTKSNYVKRQSVLSQKLVDEGKIKEAAPFEQLIGKATGQFIETHLHGNLSDMAKEEKLEEIKRLKTLQEERLKITNESSLSSSHKKSGKQNVH